MRKADPISWDISHAAWTLVAVLVVFAVLEGLQIGPLASSLLMWLALALILTVICRVQRIRFRDLATLLVPAVLLLAVLPFAADNTLRLVTTFVVFFGAIAIPLFPTTLVAWIGFVAPDYYRAIGESEQIASETFVRASESVQAELVAPESESNKLPDAVAAARASVLGLGSLDAEWEEVMQSFLRYLDWYDEVSEPTDEDWVERRARLNSALASYETVLKSRSQSAAHRIFASTPSAGKQARD
jgi:hypothetical protein